MKTYNEIIQQHEFVIENNSDVIQACQMLDTHKEGLPGLSTLRARNWTVTIISKIESALYLFNPDYEKYYTDWKLTAV